MARTTTLTRPDTSSPDRSRPETGSPDSDRIAREARRILRRLSESGAFLAVSPSLDKAIVLRAVGDARPVRIGIVDRTVAEAFVLQDWIALTARGRVNRYGITSVGRAALKRMLDADGKARVARKDEAFADQHREMGTRRMMSREGRETRHAVNLCESPITVLARRKGPDGVPYLTPGEVDAGERLREDFERAQMGVKVSQNWDRFLTVATPGSTGRGRTPCDGPSAARTRVMDALKDLGPGLGDIALRCCCFLEGLEAAERRMGWSARSGKVVLKIALSRLAQHYGLTGRSPDATD